MIGASPQQDQGRSRTGRLLAGTLGLAAAVACAGWLRGEAGPNPSWPLIGLISAGILAGTSWGTLAILDPWLRSRLDERPMHWRRGLWTFAVVLPPFLAMVWPVPLDNPTAWLELELRVVEEAPRPGQKGAEVWLRSATSGSREALLPQGWQTDGQWRREGTDWLGISPEAGVLRWSGKPSSRELVLTFVSHPWSGTVEARVGDTVVREVLFSPETGTRVIRIPLAAPPLGPVGMILWVFSSWFAATLLVLSLALLLGRAPDSPRGPERPIPLGLSLAIVFAGQVLYFLAFHPGLMSNDSVDQWGQSVAGPIYDYHPAIHTLLHRAFSRTLGSPAGIILLQQVAYAWVVALWVRALGRMGVPRRALLVTLVVAGTWLVPGLLMATVWKDIAYSLGTLALSYGLLRQLQTGGKWLARRSTFVWMVLSLAGVLLLRHNGLLTALASLAGLFFLSMQRRRVVALGLLALTCVVLVKGPLYRWVKVRSTPSSFALQNQVHQMAALVAAGVDLTIEQAQLLERIQPLEVWRNAYYCYTLTPSYYNDTFSRPAFDANLKPFLELLWTLGKAHPEVLWERQRCVSSYVWRVRQAPDAYLYTHHDVIDENEYGLEARSLLPGLKASILEAAQWTRQPGNIEWAWRPSSWLYLCLAAVGLAVLRTRNVRLGWILVPVLANAASLLLLSPSQSMRYAFSAHLLGIFLPAFLTSGSRRGDPETAVPTDPERLPEVEAGQARFPPPDLAAARLDCRSLDSPAGATRELPVGQEDVS